MSTMTLDELRSAIKAYQSPGYTTIPTEVTAGWIDAIDAHLAAREAAWVSPQSLRNLAGGQSTREWMWAEKEEGDIPLYAAPIAKETAAPAEQPTTPDLHENLRAFLSRDRAITGVPQEMVDAGIAAYKRETRCEMSGGLMRMMLVEAISATPDLSDRYRAVMEAQGGVTDERPIMPYSGTEAASMMRTVIDDILSQAKGTHETAHDFVAWHLPRIRSLLQWIDAALATHPHTGYSAVPEGWIATIKEVVSALDVASGDSDPNIKPDMTDDEVREEYPEVWAMQKLSVLLAAAPEVPK